MATGLFTSNQERGRFTPDQWLAIVRAHWRVENGVHQTLDVAFAEDDRLWPRDPRFMLNLLVLRRIAANALTLFRVVSHCSEAKGTLPWRDLFAWILVGRRVVRNTSLSGTTAGHPEDRGLRSWH
ncbi:MAG: hypothetical protein EXR76_03890 [Myxococcales bacterium]|nr:hypothetical protein [Myxococcales bacterium]